MMDGNTVLLVVGVALVIALGAIGIVALSKRERGTPATPRSPANPPTDSDQRSSSYQQLAKRQADRLQRAIDRGDVAELRLDVAREDRRTTDREREANELERQIYGRPRHEDKFPEDEGRRDRHTTTQREPTRDTGRSQRQPQRYTLTINGTAVWQGQNRMNVLNGHITLDPAPGPQGYDEGTRVTLVAHPGAGARVTWRGARVEGGPFRAIVTMNQDRQVQVTIVPPVATPTPTPTATATPQPTGTAVPSRAEQLLARARNQGIQT